MFRGRSTGHCRRTRAEAIGLTGKAGDPFTRQRKGRGPRVLMVGAAESAP